MIDALARHFLDESARYLVDVHLPRLERALAALPPEDLFYRPHRDALAFGTILLHLEGNVRQWILSGIAREPDVRNRADEFAIEDGHEGPRLFARLSEVVTDAACVLRDLDATLLLERRIVQGFDTTILGVIYHVVEHFSWHVGQAVWIAKARAGAGHGLSFYDDAVINAARNPDSETDPS